MGLISETLVTMPPWVKSVVPFACHPYFVHLCREALGFSWVLSLMNYWSPLLKFSICGALLLSVMTGMADYVGNSPHPLHFHVRAIEL